MFLYILYVNLYLYKIYTKHTMFYIKTILYNFMWVKIVCSSAI